MSKIITVTNQKGGVGKTTTCNALLCGLAMMGKKVLGIDLDPQGSLGFSLGLDIEEGITVHDLLKGTANAASAIRPMAYGDFISSNILLSTAELEFNQPGREYLLRNAIQDIKDRYDFIIIDTPPALNVLTVNAYVAADSLIVPMVPEILSLLGISQIKETIDSVKKSFHPSLDVSCILLTKFSKRTVLAQEVEEMANEIARQLGTIVVSTRIRASVAVAEAPAHGQGILEYAPKSKASIDYSFFVKMVCNGRFK